MSSDELTRYLSDPPDSRHPDLPVRTLAPTLPLHKLAPRNFERLCARLIRARAEIEDARLYGAPGEKQDGIDVYTRLPDGEYHVFQCRRTKNMGPADIRHAVDDFLEGDWADKASTFVLCTSTSFERTARVKEIEEQTERLRALGKTFIPWGREEISEELRDEPRIVTDFFHPAWEEVFCRPTKETSELPSTWVMRDPAATFSHRGYELKALDAAVSDTEDGSNLLVLHGLSGIGKSQVAAAWADSQRSRFRIGWWLDAADEASRTAGLAALSRELGLAEPDTPDPVAASAVREALERETGWLLILDDLPEPSALRSVVPRRGGTVVVTSRNHGGWRILGGIPIGVEPWSEADGAAYLHDVTQDADVASARAITSALDGLPLALAQAASYCDQTGIGLSDYLG